jgi:hypothetical protein
MADADEPTAAPPPDAESGASASPDVLPFVAPAASGDAQRPTSDAFEKTDAPAKLERAFSNKKTPDEKALALIALVEAGVSVREAASQVDVNIRTAYEVLARGDLELDNVRATVRRLMAAEALERVEDWRLAAQVGAAKKGNHAPARDWLLHAGVIDELSSDSSGVRVAIHIGTDERPLKIPSPLTIAAEYESE